MISFKSLDDKLVKFDGNLSLKSLNLDDEPELFEKYFTSAGETTDWEVCVGVVVCVGDEPVWGVASYGEQYDRIMDTEDELNQKQKDVLMDEYYCANDAEMQHLEFFVHTVVMPQIIQLIDDMSDDKSHILDVRHLYADECNLLGFYIADVC